jgi:hypothetical protein
MSESLFVMWCMYCLTQLQPWDCDFESLTGPKCFSFLFYVLWRLEPCTSMIVHPRNSAGVLIRIIRTSAFGWKSLLVDILNPNIKKL